MSDLPYSQAYKKLSSQPVSGSFNRRHSEGSSFLYNGDIQLRSSSFQGYQQQLQQRKIFGFELFVNNQILSQLEPVEEWFKRLQQEFQVESIKFNLDLGIPDLDGRNIQIFDHEMDKKYHCAKRLLHDVYHVFKKIKKQVFAIIIFVPEGMVSLLIGTKGHQINKIMRESSTKIVINQPINKMTYRTAKIQGHYSDIARACRMIYEILEEKSSIAYAIQKQPSHFDYTKSKIKTKLLFAHSVIRYLTKRRYSLMSKIQTETKCSVDYESDRKIYSSKEDDQVIVINGKLEDVQAYIVLLLNTIHPYFLEQKKNHDYTLKMLIPANYVTKLIGQKGYMIKDIIERSGGAQIKILSDRQAERDSKECVISINGSIENKIDAACFILEQIECFKNGGPILQSGKSINQNLVQQFKNSIPLHIEVDKSMERENLSEMDVENTNQNTENSAPLQVNQKSQVGIASPPIKHFSTIPLAKYGQNNDKSEEEGLVEGQSDDDKETQKHQPESQKLPKLSKQIQKSDQRQLRSRSRQRRKQKRSASKRKHKSKSRSSSISFKHDKDRAQIKLLVPRSLAEDYRELEYISSVSRSKVSVSEQKALDSEWLFEIELQGNQNAAKTYRQIPKQLKQYVLLQVSSSRGDINRIMMHISSIYNNQLAGTASTQLAWQLNAFLQSQQFIQISVIFSKPQTIPTKKQQKGKEPSFKQTENPLSG